MIDNNKALIIEEAKRLGFSAVGVSKAGFLESEASSFERWLKKDYNGEMQYMENNFDKRLDPTLLVPGAKSVVSLLYNYYPDERQSDVDAPKISKFAYGQDYHGIIKQKLELLLEFIRDNIGEVDGRAFTDSAPILERAWAKKSGLGWVGKNGNMITYKQGSFRFLSELIIDLVLEPDSLTTDHCGKCTACIDACPTGAIESAHIINGSKCISYLTIELKDEIPTEFKGKMDNWIFGCDVCQDVCPWNKFSVPHTEPLFKPQNELLDLSKGEWHEITRDVFNKVFKKSTVKRTKYPKIVDNIAFLKKG